MHSKSLKRADAAFQRALALHRTGSLEEARRLCREALDLQPRHIGALQLLGVIALQNNEPAQALEALNEAVRIEPRSAAIQNNHGTASYMLGHFEAASASYERAAALAPQFADAHGNRGNALLSLARHAEAVACYDRAIALKPDDARLHRQRGNALCGLGRFADAVAAFDRAVALDRQDAPAYHNRGTAFEALQRYDEAIASYEEAIALDANYVDAHHHRGNAQFALRRFEAALASFARVVALRPQDAGAYNDQAKALVGLGRHAEAIAGFDAALLRNPHDADVHANRGGALLALGRFEDAVASFDRSIALRADFAPVHCLRGDSLFRLRRFEAAIASYGRALAADPLHVDAHHNRTNARLRICDWRNLDARLHELTQGIQGGTEIVAPFTLLTLIDSPSLQRTAAERWAREWHPADASLPPPSPPSRATRAEASGARIRLGYFTADCHEHATMYLIAGLLEHHDATRFEVTVYSYGARRHDAMRARIARACEVIDVRDLSDREVALLARQRGVDIAVDLKGFTHDARLGMFALRAAPVQIAYLGYPGTLGVDYIDYLIADRRVVPEGSEVHYKERLIFMPDSYQPNDDSRPMAERVFTRTELGLPGDGVVFCSFNNNYKILPPVFDVWMRLLRDVPGSTLWLLEDNAAAALNLREAARRRGIDPQRLVFAPRVPLAEHLARQRVADLFLDTLPCNAHTTASDALWAGLPVLTCAGAGFAARVAASLLHAVGLPDLVTTSLEQYEATALALARDPSRLADVRCRLARNLRTAPLFGTARYARHLEAAYLRVLAETPSRHP
jgi:predicted O-linked N-acetylglucosamine transferase (SPINDLY family)